MKGTDGIVRLLRQLAALIGLSFLELRRRNEVFAFVLLALTLMAPLSCASPFGVAGAGRYLDEAALLLIWFFSAFIAIGAGSRLFPPEFEARTIYPLLAKPVSRGRLLAGKYLGAFSATAAAVLLFYAIYLGSVLLRGGSFSAEAAQGIVLHLAFSALAVAVSLFFSLLVSRGASLVLSTVMLAGMFLFGRGLPVYSESVPLPLGWLLKVLYALGPHAEFFDMRQRMIHGWGPVEGRVLAVVLVYAAVYIALVLGASAIALKRKRL